MRKIELTVIASMLVAAAGCTQGTPGGPGVQNQTTTRTTQKSVESPREPSKDMTAVESHTTSKPVISEPKETFSLSVPLLTTSIKQGETKSLTISVSRGSDFKDDIDLKFSPAPPGITISPSSLTIKASEADAKVNIAAASSADLGEFTVKVTGHPMSAGADAVNEFKVNVAK